MEKKFINEEIDRQKEKLFNILKGNMQEPERSDNILRITQTIRSLKKILDDSK